MNNDELGKAMDDINTAIKRDGTDFVLYITRGEIYMAMKQYYKALNDFTKAIALNRECKVSYFNRTKCYRKLAEAEQDDAKKVELIAKAEADEKKANSMKNGKNG